MHIDNGMRNKISNNIFIINHLNFTRHRRLNYFSINQLGFKINNNNNNDNGNGNDGKICVYNY